MEERKETLKKSIVEIANNIKDIEKENFCIRYYLWQKSSLPMNADGCGTIYPTYICPDILIGFPLNFVQLSYVQT